MNIRKVKSLGAILLVLTLSALALLFTLGLCAAQVMSATDDQNLIANPGFENEDPGDPDSPAYWENGKKYGDNSTSYEWTSTYARTGKRSVQMQTYSSQPGWWQSTPPVTVTATEAYTFSGWINTKKVKGRAFLSLLYRKSDGELIEVESNSVTGDSNGWVQVQPITPVIIPSGTTTAFLQCQLGGGSGMVWFDDVVLRSMTDSVDLQIEKQAEPFVVKPGEQLTYVITYRNAGNIEAQDVVITDTLPPSVTFNHANPLAHTEPPSLTLRWDVGDLVGGSIPHYITVVVTVSDSVANGQLLTNTATIAAAGDVSPATGQITTEVTRLSVLSLEKRSSAGWVSAHETLLYTLTYRNVGYDVASGVRLTDDLPSGVEFVSSTLATLRLPGDDPLIWILPDLEAGSGGDIVITVTIKPTASGGALLNEAEIRSGAISDRDSAAAQVYPTYLGLTKRADPGVVIAGQRLTYTLEYSDNKSGVAYDVILTDYLPPGLSVISTDPLTDRQEGSHTLGWDLEDLDGDGASHTITIVVTTSDSLAEGQWLTNTATIVAEDAFPDTDQITTTVTRLPIMRLDKKSSAEQVLISETLRYTLTYRNVGSAVATEVRITDDLPSGVAFVSDTLSTLRLPGDDPLIWNISSLEVGERGDIVITVTVRPTASGQVLRNCAELNYKEGERKSDCQDIQVYDTRLGLKKSVKPDVAKPGQWLTYTLEYSNSASGVVEDVVLTDVLPPEVSFAQASPSPTLSDSGTLEWNLGNLPGGGTSHYVTIVVTVSNDVTAGQWSINEATIAAEGAISATAQSKVWITKPVSFPERWQVYLPIIVRNYAPPSLHQSTITVDKGVAYWGDTLHYTITLTNSGTTEAITPTITSEIPPNSTYITDSVTNKGWFEDGAIHWFGRVEPGKPQVIEFETRLTDSDCAFTVTNKVTITAGSAPWPLQADTQVRCVKNGGFEYGQDEWGEWTPGGALSPRISSYESKLGSFSALLGNPALHCNDVPVDSAWVTQTVLIPNTNDAKLSFWYRIFTQDRNAAFDRFEVYVNDTRVFLKAKDSGRYGCDLEEKDMDLGWQLKTINLRNYFNPDEIKGQLVTIRFENRNYPDHWFNTYTYLDDVKMIR
jgi:uncharacterized repeat protein (TIGR01451 family)